MLSQSAFVMRRSQVRFLFQAFFYKKCLKSKTTACLASGIEVKRDAAHEPAGSLRIPVSGNFSQKLTEKEANSLASVRNRSEVRCSARTGGKNYRNTEPLSPWRRTKSHGNAYRRKDGCGESFHFWGGGRKRKSRRHPMISIECGAKARTHGGLPCRMPAMANGRCRLHGGKSTGAKTAEGLVFRVNSLISTVPM